MGYFQPETKMYGFKGRVVEERHDQSITPTNRLARLYETVHSKPLAMFRKRRAPPPDGGPAAFPFLRLPRELREMIYDYVRQPEYADMEVTMTFVSGIPVLAPHGPWPEDPAAHQPPGSSGILAYYGSLPPLNLALTCKQVHHELWSSFLGTTCRIGPLTPHADEWRFDPTYQRLKTSTLLPMVRHVLVRVELVRFRMTTHHGSIRYEEIGLEECALKLQALAEMLVRVLRTRAKSLRILTIEWQDDFPEHAHWEFKASALLPFGTLEGVRMQLGELIVAESGRAYVKNMLKDTLDGLSVME